MAQEIEPKIPLEEVSDAERAMIEGARRGDDVDLAKHTPSKSGKAQINAAVLRDLILGRYGPVHERGVRLRNAHIKEQLDLSHCTVPIPIALRHCIFGTEQAWEEFCEEHKWGDDDYAEHWDAFVPLMLDRSTLHFIGLNGSIFHGGFHAEEARISRSLFIRNAKAIGPVRLSGVKIGGQLAAEGAKFKAKEGHALNAQGAEIKEGCFLMGAEFSATAHLASVKVGGQLAAEGAQFKAKKGYALNAQGAEIGEGCFLMGAEFSATAWLAGIKIGGQLFANGAKFKAKEGVALNAQRAEIEEDCFLNEAEFSATAWLLGIKVGGQLAANGAKFRAKKGRALHAQEAEIVGGCFFRRGEDGEPAELSGELCLVDAALGNLLMEGARLQARPGGKALDGEGCRIRRDCRLKDGFQASGAVILDKVRIGGELDISSGEFIGMRPAMFYSYRQLQDIYFISPMTVLINIRQQLSVLGGLALSLSDAHIRRLIMARDAAHRPRGIVDLTRAKVEVLEDYADGWLEEGTDDAHMVLDGFVYQHLLHPSGRADGKGRHEAERIADNRIRWLDTQKPAHRTHEFRPQPWTQLISVLRRDGFIDAANQLDIERRRRMRQYTMRWWPLRKFLARFGDGFLDWSARYGYRPWRAVGISLGVILAFALVWAAAMLGCAQEGCRDESVFVRTDVAGYSRLHDISEKEKQTYPDFNPVGFSFDVFIPLFNFGYQDTWAVNTSWKPLFSSPHCWTVAGRAFYRRECAASQPKDWKMITLGGFLYVLYYAEVILGAVLTTISIAGFTGLLRSRRNE